MLAALLFAATTHVVNVNADGSFSPPVVTIASGDSVQWTFSSPADSIVSINWDGTSAGYCSAVNPYSADDFTGPMPVAPGGVFTISPVTVGFVAQPAAATCAGGQSPKATAAGQMLCRGGPTTYAATMDATWQDPTLTGVFIRLLWSDIEPSLNTYDFTIVDREVAKAVKNGKVYSLGIKAGDDGTPSWLFTNGVTPLQLQDSGSDGNDPSCGSRMTLGNPTELAYQNRYFDLLRAVAAHLRSRADWYRALAYIKPSGANLFTHENRLPKRCESNCICNTQVLAQHGYTPNGLYAFYQAQTDLLASEFPGKSMSYALIQDGFPLINNSGGYEKSDGTSSNGPLPGGTEQTQTILDNGQATHGLSFVVAHNGLSKMITLNCAQNRNGVGCPNRWVLQEGQEGQVTGFQTTNDEKVSTPSDVDSALNNGLVNSQGVYIELYEERYWEAVRQPNGVIDPAGTGRTMAQWVTEFQNRRKTLFPALSDPFPTTYTRTFTSSTPKTLYYVHGAKCGIGSAAPGTIVIVSTSGVANRRRP
ncbi:MAG TPA: hypothetical protein VII75_09365, partial [Thermoanaerobaculia bacterium]